MIKCSILGNGDLSVTADNETRKDLSESLNNGRGYWSILSDEFEPYFVNGSYAIFDAGDGNPFVGLTNAPCIAESMSIDDAGDWHIEGRLWWFPDYMIRDPLRELIENGETIFSAT